MDRRTRGRRGERAAERMLRRHGLVILARNWRGAGGELDLAALDGDTLVFVEVKQRTAGFGGPHPAVSFPQRRRIARAARSFRSRYGVSRLPFRFDLVTLAGDPDGSPSVAWHKYHHRESQ